MDQSMDSNSFQMAGAREIIERTNGSVAIREQVIAIETGISYSPGIVFDLSRALVESTCKTILAERGKQPLPQGMKSLIATTYAELQLLPERFADDETTSRHIRNLIDGFENVLSCVTHLRHHYGISSHGKEGSALGLEQAHALLAARSADALVHFLYMAHKFFYAPPATKELNFSEKTEFNEFIDASNAQIEIFDVPYSPSEVLYYVDRNAYLNYLTEYEGEEAS